jgi:hypothetical protein
VRTRRRVSASEAGIREVSAVAAGSMRRQRPLAHEWLYRCAVGCAKRWEHGIRQATHRDDRFGEAPVAARVVSGNAAEPRQEQGDRNDHERRLRHERPRGDVAAREA